MSYNINPYSIDDSPEYNPIAITIGNNLLCDFAVEVSGFVLKGKKSGNPSVGRGSSVYSGVEETVVQTVAHKPAF